MLGYDEQFSFIYFSKKKITLISRPLWSNINKAKKHKLPHKSLMIERILLNVQNNFIFFNCSRILIIFLC